MMVPKGLMPGDTFKDGKRTYEVTHVNADGSYLAKAVTDTQKPETPPKPRRKRTAKEQ